MNFNGGGGGGVELLAKSLDKCPELLCGLSCDHSQRQTIQMGNSPGEKGILQGITIGLGPVIL